MTLEELIKNLNKVLMGELTKNKLPDSGDYVTCQCGCGVRFFISPIPDDEKRCTLCMIEIREEDKNEASKLYHRGRIVAILHSNCEPENLAELFPATEKLPVSN